MRRTRSSLSFGDAAAEKNRAWGLNLGLRENGNYRMAFVVGEFCVAVKEHNLS